VSGPAGLVAAARRTGVAAVAAGAAAALLLAAAALAAAVAVVLPDLAGERERTAAVVATSVERSIERALALGVPFDRLAGMPEFLSRILRENPDLRFVAATGADGTIAYWEGVSRHRLQPILDAGALDGAAPVGGRADLVRAEADGFSILALALDAPAGPAGRLLVGTQPRQILEEAALALPDALRILAFAALLGAAAGWAAWAGVAGDRAAEAQSRLGALGGTRIPRLPRPPRRDELGAVEAALDRAALALHDRYRRVLAHAEEVRGAVFDADVAARAAEVERETAAAHGPALAEPPPPAALPRPGRLTRAAVALSLSAGAAAAAFLALGPPAAAAFVAAAAVVAATPIPRETARALGVVGALAAVAGFAGAAAGGAAPDPATAWASAPLVAGAGLGLAAAALRRHPARGDRATPLPPAAAAAFAAACATLLGPLAGSGALLVLGAAAALAAALSLPPAEG
jgi:hypothetical protein